MSKVINQSLDSNGVVTGTETTEYDYDTSGNRVVTVHTVADASGTITSETRTEYLTDSNNPTGYSQVIEETEFENGVETKKTVYTIGHDQISQTIFTHDGSSWVEGDTHHFGYDGHGSVRVLYDTMAAIVQSAANSVLQLFHFDAYGNLLNMQAVEALTSYLYSGEVFDSEIGQQYLRARWYDPANGRFNRLDPFFGNTSDPQSLHKYLYVHGDPISWIDPSGLLVSTTSSTVSVSLAANLGITLLVAMTTYQTVKSLLATAQLQRIATDIGVDIGTDVDVDNQQKDKSRYYFVHGSSTGVWSGPMKIYKSQLDLDFGSGLYAFSLSVEGPKDKPITGFGAAKYWARRQRRQHGGMGFVLLFAVAKTSWTTYRKMDLGTRTRPHTTWSAEVNKNRASKVPVFYPNIDVVFGPTAIYSTNQRAWVVNNSLPRQFKFQTLDGVKPLLIVPAGLGPEDTRLA